ncbi:hypothetical protein WDU94_013306, partial [Cyamophila willieti]
TVPPERPEIFDFRNKDKQHRKIEAFNEGQELRLLCQVIGGRPQPKVVWFLESQLIEGRTEILDNMVKNTITIDPVSRHHLHSRLACNASNTHLITASIRQITLDVNCKYTSKLIPIKVCSIVLSSPLNLSIVTPLCVCNVSCEFTDDEKVIRTINL